jgi:mRNA-degrading endonuclease YafQ of YafQ-DinJ toxin-antitoxin module
MAAGSAYRTLVFTETFIDAYASQDFSIAERARFRKALRMLDENERHPSLRVHELRGDLAGVWSAIVSNTLQMTFERLPDGRKLILTCSRHYGR